MKLLKQKLSSVFVGIGITAVTVLAGLLIVSPTTTQSVQTTIQQLDKSVSNPCLINLGCGHFQDLGTGLFGKVESITIHGRINTIFNSHTHFGIRLYDATTHTYYGGEYYGTQPVFPNDSLWLGDISLAISTTSQDYTFKIPEQPILNPAHSYLIDIVFQSQLDGRTFTIFGSNNPGSYSNGAWQSPNPNDVQDIYFVIQLLNQSQQIIITFDNLSGNTFIPKNQFISLGVIFSSGIGGDAFVWSGSAWSSVLANMDGGAFSLPNAIAGNIEANDSVIATFVDPATSLPATTNFVQVGVSSGPGPDLLSPNVALLGFDSSGTLIASDLADTTLQFDTLSISAPNIARVEMMAGHTQDIFDNFTYNFVVVPPNQPPTLSFPTADSYTENGINPNKGTVETEFIFKTVYTDADNDPPQNISLIIGDGAATTTRALAVDASAPIELRDGNYANGEQFTATSTFSKKAKYFYHFEASDEKGSIARLPETEELNFSVNQSPVALFTFTPQIPKVDEDIIFDASSSYDPDSQLIRYEWDWDNDGEYDDSSELATMTMRWPLSGSFVVRLRVIDDSGVEANSTTSLLVSGTARSELAALIIFAFIDVGNTLFWQNIAFDTPIIKHLFPSYREFKKIDEWLRKDAIGNVSGNPLDWIKNDQRFEEFSQYITYADIITLLHENIPETNITYEDRIRTIIFEYQIADYALQRGFRTETGYRQAMRTFKEIGKQLVKWIPIIGDLITGDSFDEVVLKETIKRGTKVALKEILIRKVFEEMSAEELSESGVNYVWMAYKIYSGIRNLNNEANIQTYENRLASYFACLNPLIGGNQAFCWQQTKNVDNNSSIPVLADEDEVEFMQLWKKYGDNSSAGNIHGISQVKLEELQDIVKVIVLDALEQYKNKVPNRLYADINSPVEMRIIDQDGVAVGVVDGVVKEDIPRSVYNQEDEAITIILPPTDISFQLVGTADETYEFIVTSIENGIVGKFKSIDIPTNKGIVHKYNIDWQALFRGEKGVTVEVDENGDGIIDYQFKTSSKLEDKTSPTTQILLAGKSGINNWYTTDVTVTFTAEDNADGGVGVRRTEYSLDNGTTWQNYIVPLILTQESIHTLLYRSIDFLGNIENIHSQTIKIDKTSPEAKIFFDQNLKQLNIEGIDNLSSVAVVQNGNNYTLTDEAGHTLVIAFDKLKTEGKEIKAEISALRYDGIPIPAIPKNKLQYEWSLEKNGDIKELNQRIEIEKNFDVHAHYDAKKDKTKVDAKIEDKEDEKKIQQTIPGLTILILTTNFGNFFVDY